MGIKDNFSQAVKELWKKDGAEDNTDGKSDRTAQPTELDKYLSEQPAPAPAQPQAPRQEGGYQFTGSQPGDQGAPLETPYYRQQPAQGTPAAAPAPGAAMNASAPAGASPAEAQQRAQAADGAQNSGFAGNQGGFGANGSFGANGANNGFGGGNGGYVPPTAPGAAPEVPGETDEVTVISRNTIIDGNVRSLANMQVDGNIKGNVETTRDIDMSGKVVGDIKCNNASMNSAAMQGNVTLKGKMRMDRDTILIGDLTSQYADVNGRIRGKLEIGGKAELKRDAIVFGDINASTIAVTDGAIIQGYVNTTFLSKEDSRSVFPEAISFDSKTTEKA